MNVDVAANLPLVHSVARKLEARLAAVAEYDELVSAGTLGLMTAAKAFDSTRGLRFSTFAIPRIRGAILDDVRRRDSVSRQTRRWERSIKRASNILAVEQGRVPVAADVARVLDISVEELERRRAAVHASQLTDLDACERPSLSVVRADAATECEDEQQWLTALILQLPAREQDVLVRHFVRGETLTSIAKDFGFTVGYISFLKTNGLRRLRERMPAAA